MTTIQAIPEEILNIIFKNLASTALNQCQRVCHSWYHPAHLLFLEIVHVKSIRKFIKSIDYNPSPAYLNAIKFIFLSDLGYSRPLDNVAINKVFCRFPNLEHVDVSDGLNVLAEFDDQKCQTILDSCPNLNFFYVSDQDIDLLSDTIPKLRLLLTFLNFEKVDTQFMSPLEFLADYPRLRVIHFNYYQMTNFEQWLPFVEAVPHLEEISGFKLKGDRANFFSRFLSTKTKEKQDLIVERLSKIRRLYISYSDDLYLDSMAFAVKHFTGLTNMDINGGSSEEWTDQQWQAYVDVLGWACTVKVQGAVYFSDMKLLFLSKYLRSIADKIFRKTHRERLLIIRIIESQMQGLINVCVTQEPHLIEMSLVGTKKDILTLIETSFKSVDVDTLDLIGNEDKYNHLHDKIVKCLPSLKKVIK